MNHRKIRSHGYIPFSWEEKPGIPKSTINHHKSSSDMGIMRFDDDQKMLSGNLTGGGDVQKAELTSIAPPPPWKSCSRWRDDPFVAALKSCSKGDRHLVKEKMDLKKSSLFFSCKQSCNVEKDNLVKFSKLPPIPKERYYAKSFVRNLR